jgi:hypothetical protein
MEREQQLSSDARTDEGSVCYLFSLPRARTDSRLARVLVRSGNFQPGSSVVGMLVLAVSAKIRVYLLQLCHGRVFGYAF